MSTTVENEQTIEVPSKRKIATVTAWPDEVQVEIHAVDGSLTVEQANELASQLVKAVNQAKRLDWGGTDDEPGLVERPEVDPEEPPAVAA